MYLSIVGVTMFIKIIAKDTASGNDPKYLIKKVKNPQPIAYIIFTLFL